MHAAPITTSSCPSGSSTRSLNRPEELRSSTAVAARVNPSGGRYASLPPEPSLGGQATSGLPLLAACRHASTGRAPQGPARRSASARSRQTRRSRSPVLLYGTHQVVGPLQRGKPSCQTRNGTMVRQRGNIVHRVRHPERVGHLRDQDGMRTLRNDRAARDSQQYQNEWPDNQMPHWLTLGSMTRHATE
jgi:hypothetical protein